MTRAATERRRDRRIVRLLGIGSARVGRVRHARRFPTSAEVAFDGVSADVTASGFHGAQEYRTVSGDLVLDRIGGDVRVRGVSGDVSIRADEPIQLEMNTRQRRRLGGRSPLRRSCAW